MQLTENERAALVDGRYNSEFHKGLVSAIARGMEASRNSGFGDSGTVNRIANVVTHYLLTTRREPAALCRCGHPESDHYKYILNGAETWSCKSCDPTSGLAGDHEIHPDVWAKRIEADHPYEADRPEPAADAVERAAKALWDYRRMNTPWETWEELRDTRPVGSAVESKSHYRDIARAALAAAGDIHLTYDEAERISSGDFNNGYEMGREHEAAAGPSLDEMLDSVHPECKLHVRRRITNGKVYGWVATIGYDGVSKWQRWDGTGPTRMDAIRNAVAQATGRKERDDE